MNEEPSTIRVAIVEDDPHVRSSLALLIKSSQRFHCCGQYGNGEQACREIPLSPPDVAVVDLELPKMSGIECVRRLKGLKPELQMIILTVYDDSDQIFRALEAGASGYILKRTPPEEILQAIEEVYHGGAPMTGSVARKVVQTFQKDVRAETTNTLSQRERDILDYVAQGYVNKEIADTLGVGLETVRTHLKSIYEKLHVRSRTEAAMKYFSRKSV